MTRFLSMIKPLGRVCPIIVGQTLYQLTSRVLCFEFHNAFATHFSPHQFEAVIKGDCEVIIHAIKCALYLYPN
jgi:hypothetical protein